jgi:hypothetical protein
MLSRLPRAGGIMDEDTKQKLMNEIAWLNDQREGYDEAIRVAVAEIVMLMTGIKTTRQYGYADSFNSCNLFTG